MCRLLLVIVIDRTMYRYDTAIFAGEAAKTPARGAADELEQLRQAHDGARTISWFVRFE
jgi:hypothetical protein